MDDIIEYMVEKGLWIVGTPDDCISGILRLNEASGGFGCLLVHSHEWASREKLLKSYELIARYVFPYFQGSLIGLERSVRWTQSNLENALEMRRLSIDKAKNDWTNRE
jgi:limonene 1,2-monooxygenase